MHRGRIKKKKVSALFEHQTIYRLSIKCCYTSKIVLLPVTCSQYSTSAQEVLCWSVYHCIYHYSASKLNTALVQTFKKPIRTAFLVYFLLPYKSVIRLILHGIISSLIKCRKTEYIKLLSPGSSFYERRSQWQEKNSVWCLFIWISLFQSWYSESRISLTSHNEDWLLMLAAFREDWCYLKYLIRWNNYRSSIPGKCDSHEIIICLTRYVFLSLICVTVFSHCVMF